MNTQEWFTLVIAVATVVYTIATILLWRVTHKSLIVTKSSLDTMTKSTYGITLQGIAENHREIAFKALGHEKLQSAFMSPNPEDRELDPEIRLFANVLINHCETVYEHCRFKTIPDEFREPILNDIALSFKHIPALRRRWREMEHHVEPEFRKFVNDRIADENASGVKK